VEAPGPIEDTTTAQTEISESIETEACRFSASRCKIDTVDWNQRVRVASLKCRL